MTFVAETTTKFNAKQRAGCLVGGLELDASRTSLGARVVHVRGLTMPDADRRPTLCAAISTASRCWQDKHFPKAHGLAGVSGCHSGEAITVEPRG